MNTIEIIQHPEPSIGEQVARDYRKAEIFRKHKIDFCCGGKKTLSEVCTEKKLDIISIGNELRKIDEALEKPNHNYEEWSAGFLIQYILNVHHQYVRNSLPILLEYTRKVARVHGSNHPEVILIAENFLQAAEELVDHMKKEEDILFPYIMQLDKSQAMGPRSAFGSVKNPIQMMEHEHQVVGDLFKTIRELSNNYTPPGDSCMTYKVSFLKLQEFEEDLHQHIHLENNILFPKSIVLEALKNN
jgi:regulator of cell morphogenesis and NO signaling